MNTTKKMINLMMAVVFIFFMALMPVRAATVNIDVNGSILGTLGIPGITVGDSFSASGSYDNSATMSGSELGGVFYNMDPSHSVGFTVGGNNFSNGNVKAYIWDNISLDTVLTAPYDAFIPPELLALQVDIFKLSGFSDVLIGGLIPAEITSIFYIGNSSLFSGTALPVSPADFMGDVNFLGVFAFVADVQTDSLVVGQVSAVPLPAAVWLFGSGLVGIVGLARRKKV